MTSLSILRRCGLLGVPRRIANGILCTVTLYLSFSCILQGAKNHFKRLSGFHDYAVGLGNTDEIVSTKLHISC